MTLVVEIRRQGAILSRNALAEGRHVVGSNDQSALGRLISVSSNFVKSDHALIDVEPLACYLTPRLKEVRLDDRGAIAINKRYSLEDGSVFRIGNVDFHIIDESVRIDPDVTDAILSQSSEFEILVSEVQRLASRDTERKAGEGVLDRGDPEYRDKLIPIVNGHLTAKLARADQYQFEGYALECLRRDLILRLLGHRGLFSQAAAGEGRRVQRSRLDTFVAGLFSEMEIDPAPKPEDRQSELFAVSERLPAIFASNVLKLNRALFEAVVAETARNAVIAAMDGVGPLEPLMEIASVSEVMVVGHRRIFVEIDGQLAETGLSFRLESEAKTVATKIATRSGTGLNSDQPFRDARLSDGSRVNLVIDPISLSGPTITIRKFQKRAPGLLFFRRQESLSSAMASFLKGCVVSKKNILVSGGTGTGKTSFVNFLASMIPPGERIVSVEDTAELKLADRDGGCLRHVVTLQAKAKEGDSEGYNISALVHNALRMRPDRIIVGECRGSEAFDMLQAMNTGHEGSMTTLHANDPEETIARLENLVMGADEKLPLEAIRAQIASAIDFVVQLTRYSNGKRKVSAIAEVGGITPNGRIEVNPIFETIYNAARPAGGPRFVFAGRTPLEIREIIDGGFKPRRLRF